MAVTPHPEIQVYASFPRVVQFGPELDLSANNWDWVHCLTFPLETLGVLKFSPRPYKWIRYTIGVVVGAEGDLFFSPDSLNIVDYSASLPAESAALYYHTSDDERRRMFPLDSRMASTNNTSSVATPRRSRFRSDAADREGNQCVLTGKISTLCDAVHLLAHSKGDSYISTYTERRSRDPNHGDLVQEIDSVRNGLFLNKFTHAVMGKHVAFLPTPNFALDTADIISTAPPDEKRCTAHLFDPNEPSYLGDKEHTSGSPLRISATADWPPAILFDAVYASTVLHHFGTRKLKDVVSTTWNNIFHPGGVMNQAEAEYKSLNDARALIRERGQNQAQERRTRYESRAAPDTFDMLLALPYILVSRNELQAMLREAKEKAATAEQKRVQEKVDTWNRRVIAS